MIEIKPKRTSYYGYRLMEVHCNKEIISTESDIITLNLNSTDQLKLDITKDGWIRIWVEGNKGTKKIKNKGNKNSLYADFKLEENIKKEK